MTNKQKATLYLLGVLVLLVWCCGILFIVRGPSVAGPTFTPIPPFSTGTPTLVLTRTPRPTPTPRRKLEFLKFRWRRDRIGNAILEGTIKNVSGGDLRFVELRGIVYDKSGEIVNTHCSYIDSDVLYKGASSTFTIYVDDPNDAGVRARVEVESYRE